MYKYFRFFVLTAIFAIALTSCDDEERTLVSIAVTTQPAKTVYTVGEAFDPAGMVVTATFSNGDTEQITVSELAITYDFATAGAKTVTIAFTYDGKTVSASVNVMVNLPEVTLVSIAVTTQPTKKEYTVGEAFDPAGMVVTATYSDQTTGAVAHGDLVLTYDFSAADVNKTVTVSFTYKDVTKTDDVTGITVNEPASGKIVSVVATALELSTHIATGTWTASFRVTTENIDNDTYTVTVTNLPEGVNTTLASPEGGNIVINNNQGILRLRINSAATPGTYSNLTLTVDGATSTAFTLIVWGVAGFGTEADPFQIGTAEQLALLAEIVNEGFSTSVAAPNNGSILTSSARNFKLTADINLDVAPYNTGKGWTPIGKFDNNMFGNRYAFSGIFDGNGKTISGLFINDSELDYAGLFGFIGGGGVASNLNLVGVNVTGNDFVGGLAGVGGGSNCSVTGSVSGNNDVGGMVGNGGMTNGFSAVTVNGNNDVGGIAGRAVNITNSYATGAVNGNNNVGGIAGVLIGSFNVTNSYAFGTVSGNKYVGGLVGRLLYGSSKVNNCIALNLIVKGTDDCVSRIVGISYGTFGNNFAFSGMGTDGGVPFKFWSSHDDDGTDISAASAKTLKTYEDIGWKFGDDDDNPWKWVGGSYPLPVLYWQDENKYPTLPAHLR